MGVEEWKYKFLFPFGNIAPIADKDEIPMQHKTLNGHETSNHEGGEFNDRAFYRLTSKKYLFPIERIHKHEWLKELQSPINITAGDIVRDLYKFVKDFPIDIIPHMTEDELLARSKERDLVKPKNYDQLLGGDAAASGSLMRSPSIHRMSKPLHFDKSQLTCHHV